MLIQHFVLLLLKQFPLWLLLSIFPVVEVVGVFLIDCDNFIGALTIIFKFDGRVVGFLSVLLHDIRAAEVVA